MEMIDNTMGQVLVVHDTPDNMVFEITDLPKEQKKEVRARKFYTLDGMAMEYVHTVHVDKYYCDKHPDFLQHVKDELIGKINKEVESEKLKSIPEMARGISMAQYSYVGNANPKDMVEAIFTSMKDEVYDRITNESDVDLEKQLQEVTMFMMGMMMKRCRKVAVDKDIPHMKYRVILDLELNYDEVDKWLSPF